MKREEKKDRALDSDDTEEVSPFLGRLFCRSGLGIATTRLKVVGQMEFSGNYQIW